MTKLLKHKTITYRCDPSPPPPSCADGVEECDVSCIVCCKLSPVSDPLLIVLRRLPKCPAVSPDGSDIPDNPLLTSPKNLTMDGMTYHARWQMTSLARVIIKLENSSKI